MNLTKADLKVIEKAASPVRRKARTISLDDEQFERFQKLCKERDWQPNRVLDMLILMFMEAAE